MVNPQITHKLKRSFDNKRLLLLVIMIIIIIIYIHVTFFGHIHYYVRANYKQYLHTDC